MTNKNSFYCGDTTRNNKWKYIKLVYTQFIFCLHSTEDTLI